MYKHTNFEDFLKFQFVLDQDRCKAPLNFLTWRKNNMKTVKKLWEKYQEESNCPS